MLNHENDILDASSAIEEAQRLVDIHRRAHGVFSEFGKLVVYRVDNRNRDNPKLLEVVHPIF